MVGPGRLLPRPIGRALIAAARLPGRCHASASCLHAHRYAGSSPFYAASMASREVYGLLFYEIHCALGPLFWFWLFPLGVAQDQAADPYIPGGDPYFFGKSLAIFCGEEPGQAVDPARADAQGRCCQHHILNGQRTILLRGDAICLGCHHHQGGGRHRRDRGRCPSSFGIPLSARRSALCSAPQ